MVDVSLMATHCTVTSARAVGSYVTSMGLLVSTLLPREDQCYRIVH